MAKSYDFNFDNPTAENRRPPNEAPESDQTKVMVTRRVQPGEVEKIGQDDDEAQRKAITARNNARKDFDPKTYGKDASKETRINESRKKRGPSKYGAHSNAELNSEGGSFDDDPEEHLEETSAVEPKVVPKTEAAKETEVKGNKPRKEKLVNGSETSDKPA